MGALERYRVSITAVLIALILVGGFVFYLKRPEAAPIAVADNALATATATSNGIIKVYVSGAVASPGVYTLEGGDRVEDAIKAAGGPSSNADLSRVNLAKRITDEQQVNVPVIGSTPAPAGTALSGAVDTAKEPSGPVNINTANEQELQTLPGIGQVFSQRIIQYREANGPFKSIEDIKKVEGIGDGRFQQIKDLITT